MKHHETNQTSRQREQQFFWQVHGQTSLTASHDITSFVGQRRDVMRWPPASFSALRDCKLVAIPGGLSSKARGPSSVLTPCRKVGGPGS